MADIDTVVKEIAGDISRGESICFFLGVGAGVDSSLDESLQLPVGDEIKRQLLELDGIPSEEQLKKELKVETLTPEMVWGKVIEKRKHSVRLTILQELFEYRGDNVLPVPSTYRFVAKLALFLGGRVTLLTTNFDEKLDMAFREQMQTPGRGAKPILVTAASNRDFGELIEDTTSPYPHPILYKLHGTLSRPHTIISTHQQTLDSNKKRLLNQVMKKSDVIIFVGYRGADEDIRKAFESSLKAVTRPQTHRIYWLLHRSQNVGDYNMKRILDNAAEQGFSIRYPKNINSSTFFRNLWRELNRMGKKPSVLPSVVEIDKAFCVRKYGSYTQRPFTGITDSIYGRISLPQNLCKVIDSGAIQRLRNIKQLSMAYYVFPGATHTRFSHSLGVAHLMNRSLGTLGKDKRNEYFGADPSLCFDCVLASLLHDIGHGPFGHSVEMFMNRIQTNTKRNHEDFTIEFVRDGLLDLNTALNKVNYNKDKVMAFLSEDIKIEPKFFALKMLLANSGFDIDRLDFLMRDLYHSGLDVKNAKLSIDPYSHHGRESLVNTILESLLVTEANMISKEEKKIGRVPDDGTIICFRDSEEVRKCIDDFFKLYVLMYHWVYYRDINRCAQSMLSKALSFAYDVGELEIGDIHALTDQELFSSLERSPDNRVRELANCVKYRYLFEPISEFKPQPDVGALEIEQHLQEHLEVDEKSIDDMIIVDIAPAKRIDEFVCLDDGERLRRYRFEPGDDLKDLKNAYNKLKKPRGYVFIPPALREKTSLILKCLETSNLVENSVTRLGRW